MTEGNKNPNLKPSLCKQNSINIFASQSSSFNLSFLPENAAAEFSLLIAILQIFRWKINILEFVMTCHNLSS